MKYFAYGSNMLESRLMHQSRTPTASYYCSAVVRGHVLLFHKIGQGRSGKANMVKSPNPNSEVFGVLYDIDPSEFSTLAEIEHGYARTPIVVESIDLAYTVEAETFIAKPEYVDELIIPFEWYKALVIAGALEHEFPVQYINKLRECASKRDPDDKRRNCELVALGRFREAFETGCLTQICANDGGGHK